MDASVVATYWVVAADDIPPPEDRERWLYDQWERLDRWIDDVTARLDAESSTPPDQS